MTSRLLRRLRALLRPAAAERDLEDELRFHLEREAAQFARDGLSPQDARAAAVRSFGGFEPAKEACRDARGIRMLTDFARDVRYALRTHRRRPALGAVIVATMGVCIGANAAIFSIVDGVLLRPLPFPDSDQLVVITESTTNRPEMSVSYPDYLDWRARQHAFDDMAATIVIGGVLTGHGEPARVFGRAVTRSFFSTLQARFALGRPFTDEEDRPGGPRVAILSYGLWQRRYGGDAAQVGRTITYNNVPYTVVGVMPAALDFYGVDNANNDLWLPLGQFADEHYMNARDVHPVSVIARLTRGKTLGAARLEMSALAASIAAEHPDTNAGVGARIRGLLDDYVGDVRLTLLGLLVAAALVLVVACANIANLLLGKATTRRREIAMRLALGASRGRLVRQLATETLIPACAGGALGVALAVWAVAFLPYLDGALPRIANVAIDWRVALFALVLTLAAGIGCAIVPAFSVGGDRQASLQQSAGRHSAAGRRLREAFVLVEIALSVCLLVAAGVLLRSAVALHHVDPGYRGDRVVTMRVRLPDGRYTDRRQVMAFLDRLLERVSSIPAVESACLTTGVPLGRANDERFTIDGRPLEPGPDQPVALAQWVSRGYYRTFGIPLVAGRYFSDVDGEGADNVAIVDEEFVRRYFPSRAPALAIGERIRLLGEGDRPRRIIGVVRHIRHAALDEAPKAEIYAPYEQMEPGWQLEIGRAMDVAILGTGNPAAIVSTVRNRLRGLDADLPLSHVQTMPEALAASMATRTLAAQLVGAFAAAAFLLSILGVYGVMNYAVTERTREIGVRLALGARRDQVLQLIVAGALRLTALGTGAGLLLGAAASQLLQQQLFAVSAHDPLTLVLASTTIGAAALLASYLPARRAMQLDPISSLRDS
jgi:predicted permease